MGIDDPHRLEIGVDDDGPHELHATALQILGNRIRKFGTNLACLIDHLPFRPVPEIAVKTPPLLLDGLEYPGIVHSGADFLFVADDAGLLHQLLQFLLAVGADRLQVKAVKGLSEGLPLVEDTFPG